MQALVIAHAAYGHNHFFKNNYQFQLWTQPDHIIDYLGFAKTYVAECEERFGQEAVESVLDAAHALMNQGVSRDLRPRPRNVAKREQEKAARRRAHEEATYDDIYRTLPEITRESTSSRPRRRTSSAGSACPRRTCSISSRRMRPSSRTGSASSCASCACCRSISIRSARPR
jgi:spore cortex formation protein SpoVR/YcgB (stage V sporulation)